MLTPDVREVLNKLHERVRWIKHDMSALRLEVSGLSSSVSDIEEKIAALDMRLFNLEPKIASPSPASQARKKRKPKSD